MDPEGPHVDDIEFYKIIRARLDHEDDLIVNRLSWLLISQSFLFTAFATTFAGMSRQAAILEALHWLSRVISLVGITSAGLIYVALLGAVSATSSLRAIFRARVPDPARFGLPPLASSPRQRLAGLIPPLLLPIVFLLVWLYLLLWGVRPTQ